MQDTNPLDQPANQEEREPRDQFESPALTGEPVEPADAEPQAAVHQADTQPATLLRTTQGQSYPPPYAPQPPYAEPPVYESNTPYNQAAYQAPEPTRGYGYGPPPPPALPAGSGWLSRERVWMFTALFLLLAIGVLGAVHLASFRRSRNVPELPQPAATLPISAPSPVELSNSFREIAKAIKPAVVFIRVVDRDGGERGLFGPFGTVPGPRSRPSSGSGFIITEDGYIMTNEHVVGSADRIEVTLSDGRTMRATLVGSDQETDLAVIKIDETGLPIAVLGDSDQVQQGDWVLALGSPFGLQQTLTAGIVSATGREFGGTQFSRFIQTDASINPGNSGGPLVNMRGEVIGINTLIYTPTNGNVGIGFAIASNTARQIFPELVRSGKVTRGYLGVNIEEMDEPRARAFGLEPRSGVLVAQVSDPNSPAGRAGLQSGDVIVAFNGKPVTTPRELTEAVASTPVGSKARVDFIRNGTRQSVTVEIALRPTAQRADTQRPNPPPSEGNQMRHPRIGITAQTITPEMARQMGLSVQHGALIRSVEPGSVAEEAGLAHGDVIHRFGTREVRSADDLAEAVNALSPGETVALQIERGGRMLFLTLTLE